MATRQVRLGRAQGLTMSVPSAITASAARATGGGGKSTGLTRAPQWQGDSLAYYDQIGAVRYAAQFQARALPKIRWFAATRDENGEVTESEDPELIALFDRIQDPGGGRSLMFSTYGQLDFLCGEELLLWTASNPDYDDEETWEIVSTLEMRQQGKRGEDTVWHRRRTPGMTPQELLEAPDDEFDPVGDGVQVYRWWRPHPAYTLMADAPMRSVLAECEEIVRATHSINARLISRLSGPGILAIPRSWSMKPLQQVVGEENPEEDPFQSRLTQAMITAIGKPGSAESVAPIVIRIPDPPDGRRMDDLWSLIKIWNPDEVIRELELREKALQRFAVGVDMPPEKVMGLSTSGTQHWNAWMIDEDAWSHIDPVAQSLADNLASSYLRPAAKAAGRADWKSVTVGYDPAEILTNPDGFADALKLHEALAVSDEYLRAEGNATEDDRIKDDDEMARRLFMATHQQVEVEGGALVEKQPPPAITPVPPVPTKPAGGGNGNGGPPTGEDTTRNAPPVPSGMESTYRLIGAAEATLGQIRSRVGARLRAHLAGRCPDCVDAVKGTPFAEVAAALGPAVVMEHGPDDLMALAMDGGREFVDVAVRMGVSTTQAQALAEVLELHVISTIYEVSPDLPAGFLGRVKALSGAAG